MAHGHGHPGGHHDHGGHHQPLPHHHEQHHQPVHHGHHHDPHRHAVPVIPIPIPVTHSYLPTTVGTPLLVHRRPLPPGGLVGLLTCIGLFVLIVVLLILWI